MKLRRYQWVGLLAGFPLFSGAWAAAYFNNQLWMIFGSIVAIASFYVAVRVERRSDAIDHLIQGGVAALLAANVARMLGVLSYDLIDKSEAGAVLSNGTNVLPQDVSRIIIGGTLRETALYVVLFAALGVLVSLFEPQARNTTRRTRQPKKARKA
jgi:hypothetical protein